MKTDVIHRTKLLVMAICLFVIFGIKGSASAYSFEEDFFASEPKITEIVDKTRDIKYKGLVGEMRLSSGGEGGRVKRETRKPFYNGTAYVFLNIPYAQKLTSENVFELPQKLTDNSSMISRNEDETNFRHFGNYCPQVSSDERQQIYGNFCYSHMDIDCLNLNVFAPDLEKDVPKTDHYSGFPVYVLLHGGKFSHGSACDFGRPGLVHNFVREKIIVVTLNYRLGLYGFHKKSETDVMSNRGLYDQKMALEWVRDNIKFFKGDPNMVTLGGFDSGACSAAMLTLNSLHDDPFSSYLFHNVILHGGTADICRKGGVFDQDVKISATIADLKKDVALHNKLTAKYVLGMQYDIPDDVFDKPIKMIEKAKNDSSRHRKLNILMGLNLNEFVAFDRALKKFDYNNKTEEEMLEFFTEHVSIAGVRLNSTDAKKKMKAGLAEALDYYKTKGTTFDSMRMMMEYVFVHNFITFARNLTDLNLDVFIYRFDISPHPDLFYGQEIEMLNNKNVTVPHGTDVRYAYLAQQYWKQLKNNTNKALIAKQKKIGEDFSKEILVPFIKNVVYKEPIKAFPYRRSAGWDSATFLKIDKVNDSYNSSNQKLSIFYDEKAFDLWERFAVFRETGSAPIPHVTSAPPTKPPSTKPPPTKPTQPTVHSPPLNLTVDVQLLHGLEISFAPPSHTITDAILDSYKIFHSFQNESSWKENEVATSLLACSAGTKPGYLCYRITDLEPDTEYKIVVAAHTKGGDWSATSETAVGRTQPEPKAQIPSTDVLGMDLTICPTNRTTKEELVVGEQVSIYEYPTSFTTEPGCSKSFKCTSKSMVCNGTEYKEYYMSVADHFYDISYAELDQTNVFSNFTSITKQEKNESIIRYRVCPQVAKHIIPELSDNGTEGVRITINCLSLNIATPSYTKEHASSKRNQTETDLKPVVLFVHGGDLLYGSPPELSYDVRSHFVDKGIVFVAVNYRLGLYGFYNFHNDFHRATGQKMRGLHDIKKALEWIRDNIHTFRGDKDKVTLIGVSSGACLVGMLALASLNDESCSSVSTHPDFAPVLSNPGNSPGLRSGTTNSSSIRPDFTPASPICRTSLRHHQIVGLHSGITNSPGLHSGVNNSTGFHSGLEQSIRLCSDFDSARRCSGYQPVADSSHPDDPVRPTLTDAAPVLH